METKSFSSLEATFLSTFNKGHKTFDTLKDNVPFNEKTLSNIIEALIAKNILKFNAASGEYSYDSPVNGEIVILDGNIMLPVTIIKTKNKTLISRGLWYEFEPEFDTRRIIWNVQLPTNNSSTLVDLIESSILKEKRSKIVQLPEYAHLAKKLVPYSQNIKLQMNVVGEELTDVNIIFVKKLRYDDSEDFVEFRLFSVKSEIRTEELIGQLQKKPEERKYTDIQLNKIYNFSDFIFAGNSIPYAYDGESINYVTISGIRKKFELTYFQFDNNGKTTKLDAEEFMTTADGIEKVRELFNNYAEKMLIENDFLVEISE